MRDLFLAVLLRDLKLASRRRIESLLPVVFFIVALSLFPLGVGPEAQMLRDIAPGIVWVCALLASMLSVGSLFAGDLADGSLEQLLLAPQPAIAVAAAKSTAHWLLTGLPLIVAGYIICLALRAAQGSATVAILTAGGLLQPAIAAGNYSSLQVVILTLAICFGGLGLSHINDSGFWIVTKWQGLSVADGLKTWTVLTTVMSLIGFGICCLIWLVI